MNAPDDRFAAWQAAQLPILLAALHGVPLSTAEHRTLKWLAGWEADTVENIAAVIRRARETGPTADRTSTEPNMGGRPWELQVTSAVRAVFPPAVADSILADDAIGALSYRLGLWCQDTGQSPDDALRDVDADDRAFCARAEHPAAFLASRFTGGGA